MADELKPGTNMLNDQSQNVASDRARRINSLHRSVDELVQEQNRKRLQVSTVVSALTKQQQKMMAQLELERNEITTETAQGYSNVLKGLGRTINSLADGVKSISVDTGKATTDAINQYGKAIGEDISINKTNTVAMALSRATPLFGYFAAKFMETDVFQNAAGRIKDRVGSAMHEGLSKAGHSVANIFRKGKEVQEDEGEKRPTTVTDVGKLRDVPPKLQEGGYIKKGGIVEVHAAEVVTPIDKLLEQIDESKNADIAEKLNSTLSMMSESLIRMETVVVDQQKTSHSIINTFIEQYKKARITDEGAFQKRLLKAVLELKVAMVGTTSRLRIAWQRTLLQHPTFRNMLLFGDILKTTFVSPLQFLFGARGGYAGDVRAATGTDNVFMKISNMLSLLYTTLMPKMDDLLIYSKAGAEALVGREITGATQQTWTVFGKIREFLTSREFGPKASPFEKFADQIGLDQSALSDAGISSFKDLLNPMRIFQSMGVNKENIFGSMFGGYGEGDTDSWAYKKWTSIEEKLRALVSMKREQEEREGPHSPSMADNISATAEFTKKKYKEDKEDQSEKTSIFEKLKNYARENQDTFDDMRGNLRKLKGRIWDGLLFVGAFVKDMFFSGINRIMSFFQPLLAWFGATKAGGLLKSAGTAIAGSKAGKFAKTGFGKLKGLFGKGAAGGAASKAATGARGLFATGSRVVGLGATALAGGITSFGMGAWDAIQAIRDPEGFMGNFLVRGLAGFVGGTDSGFAGATSGALKGGAMGAAIGSIVPGIGTAIGGAIGAAAGGILGFVGGKRISEGLTETFKGLKRLVKGISALAMFPYKVLKEGLKSVWVLAKYAWKNTAVRAYDAFQAWLAEPGFMQDTIKWIGSQISMVVSWIKLPFIKIGEMLSPIFGVAGSFWDKFTDAMKKSINFTIKNIMFPVVGLSKAYDFLKDKFVDKISSLPVIGKLFKKGLETIRDIHEGNLANKLEKSLKDTGYQGKPNRQISSLTESQFQEIDRLAARETFGVYGGRGIRENGSYSPLTQDITSREAAIIKAESDRRRRSMENLNKNLENNQKQTAAAIVQSTNVIASSHANNVSSSGGGMYPMGGEFSSGGDFASNVTRCNIR